MNEDNTRTEDFRITGLALKSWVHSVLVPDAVQREAQA